ncbi:MAG: hypothetical protein LC732_10150 [Acidobacteria bacterium]|nr:hypothetical protein [Acidobacteriota bacterium]
MRKNLFVRIQSLYVTLFLFTATLAHAKPRTLDPETIAWWQFAKRTFVAVRRAFDVLTFPIG